VRRNAFFSPLRLTRSRPQRFHAFQRCALGFAFLFRPRRLFIKSAYFFIDTIESLAYLTFYDVYNLFKEVEIPMPKIKIRNMQVNQEGTILSVKVAGELGRRIRDMGLVPGTAIKIQGRAPLYDPVALRVKGFTLTLRNSEADHIEVEVAG
jgi:ferrous iron transport protein A